VWKWLVPLLVLLLAAGLGIWWVVQSGSGTDASASPSTAGPAATSAPSSSSHPTSSSSSAKMLTIKSSDYKGKKLDDVVSQLASMGLSVHSEGKSSSEEKNSVLEVSPEGEV